MDPVSALVLAMIFGTAVWRAAWQAAADQARVEVARGKDAVRADLRRRLEAGRAAGPVYPMWWIWAAFRAGQAARGRQDRRYAEQRPGAGATTGPAGRVAGAAFRGGAYGAREARRQYREFRDAQPGARPQRPRRPGSVPRPAPAGVCEQCGTVAAAAALAEATTLHGRPARMCARCRADADAARRAAAELDRAEAEDRRRAADGDVVDAEIVEAGAAAAGITGDTAPAGGEPGRGICCARCGTGLDGGACPDPACPLCPAYRGELAAEGASADQFRLPVRYCRDCESQVMPGTWYADRATGEDLCLFCARGYRGVGYPDGAVRERGDTELAAIGVPVDDDGNPVPIDPADWQRLAAVAIAAAGEAAPAEAAAPAADDAWPDIPRSGPDDQAAAPAALPATTPEGDNAMSCNGEVHTQADWADQSGGILAQLDAITASAENMLRSLRAREASRSQMTAAAAWADQVAAVAARGRELVDEVNARQDPYVGAVQAAGGSDEVAVPGYYAEL
jgi:hypothetical protein